MIVEDLNFLVLIDINRTSEVQGGLSANVGVNTYASQNFSVANANANAVGQFTQTYTNTGANLYQGTYSGNSSASAQATAYASEGQNNYWARATERQSYWW